MVSDYYTPRWQLFIDLMRKSLVEKKAFNQTDFNQRVFKEVELKFVNNEQNITYIVEPLGDYFFIFTCKLNDKYLQAILLILLSRFIINTRHILKMDSFIIMNTTKEK
jgi:hypothetical protein